MPPWLVLAATISLGLAFAYALVTRRYGRRILAYWLIILVGFVGAEALAEAWGWNITRLGDLRIVPDLAGATVVLLILWFLGT